MKHSPHLRLPVWQRRTLYWLLALLYVSGVAIVVAQNYLSQVGAFGIEASPWQSVALRSHGVLVTPGLLVIGSLWVVHWARGWRKNMGRLPGACMLLVMATLVFSGVLLWYGGESLRGFAVGLHWWLGLSLPVLLGLHIAWARRSLRNT